MANPGHPTLLAVDTAGDRCALALAHQGAISASLGQPGMTHLEHVLPAIEALFSRLALRPQDCDAFAFASGPGSFTGLRVACTIVQGLALGARRPVVAIGHLECLLESAAARPGASAGNSQTRRGAPRRALAVLDARLQQAFWAVFEERDARWACVAQPAVGGRDELRLALDTWQPEFCAGNAAWIRGYIGADAVPVCDAAVEAPVLARLALARLAQGDVLAPEQALPLYVRDRVAQTLAERLAQRPAELS